MKPEVIDRQLPATTAPKTTMVQIIGAAIEGGITKDNVDVLKELLAMKREEEKHQAEREFATSFVRMQREMPKIVACKPVPMKGGGVKYWYAPIEEIMTKAGPVLNDNGFGIHYNIEVDDKRVTAFCELIHIGGHSKTTKFSCRIGSGPVNASDAQSDGAATTYAKRFALCAALNIVVETNSDNDARNEGGSITQAEADELRAGVTETKAVESAFLNWLGVTRYEDIPTSMLRDARTQIAKRKAAMAPKMHETDQEF